VTRLAARNCSVANASTTAAITRSRATGVSWFQKTSSTTALPTTHIASATVNAINLLLPIHIRKGDLELRMFSTIMTLGTPQNVTLQELRIETLFPADDASERNWLALTAQ
jgi:hypothetical protein